MTNNVIRYIDFYPELNITDRKKDITDIFGIRKWCKSGGCMKKFAVCVLCGTERNWMVQSIGYDV